MKKLLFPVLCVLVASPALRAENTVKAPPLAPVQEASKQGLALTFTSGGKSDSRLARLIALNVPAGTPTTPLLPAGAFTAKWEGEIRSPLRSEYTFGAEIQGALKVTINGTVILEGAGDNTPQVLSKTFQLNKGPNKIVAEFASDGLTDARLQFTWSSSEFPPEPVPPSAFTYAAASAAVREGERLREGRLLFAQLRCTACHADAGLLPAKGQGMPELAQDAPLFADLGAKYRAGWLAQWIGDPHSIRPNSLMPRVFPVGAEGKIDPRARDLAAYLLAQGKPAEATPSAESVPLGGALFANLGCIACHTTPEHQGNDEYHRVPLNHLKAKWQLPALREYLKDPAKNYASSRMPHFRLNAEEAEQLSAFLVSGAQKDFADGPGGDAAKGAQLLVSSGCLHCHAGMPPTNQPTLATTLAGGWSKGCLAEDTSARGAAPDFALSASQRDALRAFAASGFGSLKGENPIEFAERQMTNLRCTACHSRDGQQSVWGQLENEMAPLTAAAPTETGEGHPIAGTWTPMLTWAGEKLQPAWTASFVAGRIPYKPRPYILARMPGFASGAEGIAAGLSLEHGFATAIPAAIKPGAETVQKGETLLGENGGFNCTTCHTVGDRAATAVFEAPGINLAYAHERLRKGYFDRWLLHPLRIDPETKMPRFADDEGKTPLSDVLEGNAPAQFDAIWQYLGTVAKPAQAAQ